jgi:heme-degrading monooxygenase HmoA
MVTVIVNYELAPSLNPEKVRTFYEQAVPKFEQMPGLIRKYFLLSEDGRYGGSVYLWETREQALAFHDERWKEFMRGKYGHRPHVTIYECPIVVDNFTDEVILN